MGGISNFIWSFRNAYRKIKLSISDFFGRTIVDPFKKYIAEPLSKKYREFIGTKIGGLLHRYLLRFIGMLLQFIFNKATLVYLLPVLIILGIFTFYPILNTMLVAFYENYTPTDGMMDGYTLDNFIVILKKPGFMKALQNTALIVFVSVPLSVIISLFIAVVLNSIKVFRNFFQTVFFLPYVTNVIAIGLVFTMMFDYKYGLINDFIGIFGVNPIHWQDGQASYWSAMTVLLIYTVWGSLAFKIMVFTAGLQNIDKQFYDAAKVDGTPKWRVFRRITVPLLSPMIAYVMITSFIGAFKAYTTVVSLFGETGQLKSGVDLRTIVFYVYEYINGGYVLNPGYLSKGAAASLILFAIILVFTLFQLYISKKRVHY